MELILELHTCNLQLDLDHCKVIYHDDEIKPLTKEKKDLVQVHAAKGKEMKKMNNKSLVMKAQI